MTDAPVLPDPVAGVVERVASVPGVVAVALGGSRATGTATADSDWDLGVYYRDPLDLDALRRQVGQLHPPGAWGRVMNGGAWLDRNGTRIDLLLRDLDSVRHWTDQAERGEYEVDGLLGYLAGIPTYTLTAEVAGARILAGTVDVAGEFPAALSQTAPDRWRFHRDFSLTHARRAARLGNDVVALGQFARATVEEAHARHCERRSWVVNEKRILADVGLPEVLPGLDGTGFDVAAAVDAGANRLLRSPGPS